MTNGLKVRLIIQYVICYLRLKAVVYSGARSARNARCSFAERQDISSIRFARRAKSTTVTNI